MSKTFTLEEAREFFSADRFSVTALGARIDSIDENSAVCSVELGEKHRNAVGNVMGGVIFTLADFAFAVATNNNTQATVSLNSSICFLSLARGRRLIARASCVKSGRTTCCYDISVCDELGTAVAKVVTTGFIVSHEDRH